MDSANGDRVLSSLRMLVLNARGKKRRRVSLSQLLTWSYGYPSAQCDGENPCAKCVSLDAVCHYDVPTNITKEAMKKEMEELRNYRVASEYALKVVRRRRCSVGIYTAPAAKGKGPRGGS